VDPRGEVLRKLLRLARAAGFLGFHERIARRGNDGDAPAEEREESAAIEVEPVERRDRVLGELGREARLTPSLSPLRGGRGSPGESAAGGLPRAHFCAPAFFAAICTACTMREYVPHRQTLRASAPATSSALGLAFA